MNGRQAKRLRRLAAQIETVRQQVAPLGLVPVGLRLGRQPSSSGQSRATVSVVCYSGRTDEEPGDRQSSSGARVACSSVHPYNVTGLV